MWLQCPTQLQNAWSCAAHMSLCVYNCTCKYGHHFIEVDAKSNHSDLFLCPRICKSCLAIGNARMAASAIRFWAPIRFGGQCVWQVVINKPDSKWRLIPAGPGKFWIRAHFSFSGFQHDSMSSWRKVDEEESTELLPKKEDKFVLQSERSWLCEISWYWRTRAGLVNLIGRR